MAVKEDRAMIFYFSATGNSKYLASRIAKETKDRLISITDCIKNNEYAFKLKEGENLGIVSPIYYWGLPSIVDDFLEYFQLVVSHRPYTFFAATYGTVTGQADTFVKRHLKRLGLELSASYCVRMPDTWTPIFDLNDPVKVSKVNQKAEIQIDKIIKQIKNTESGNFLSFRMPMPAVKLCRYIYEKVRETKHLSVEDSCIGCGLCAQNCSVDAIEIQSGRPVWVKDKCSICLACLHRCPQFSIQYGKFTKKHGQYLHPCMKE